MALFDLDDTFIGLTDAQFLSRIEKMSVKERESLYLKAKDKYYSGSPIMSDHQFDIMEEGLKKIGSKVVDKVGGADAPKGKLIHPHLSPMLSLAKIQVNDEDNFPIAEIMSWACHTGFFPLEATPKYDGNAVELQYRDGKLAMAVSRGDGNGKGADLTSKLRLLVPEIINSKLTLEVRGEVVMPVDVFKNKYAEEYKNPRNMIAGMLNRDDVNEDMVRDAIFVAYSIKAISADGTFKYVENAMDNLSKLGFNNNYSVPTLSLNNAYDIRDAYDWFKNYRATGRFQLDGIVLKMPENKRSTVGEGNHHPRWAVAIKFPSKEAVTKIIDVEWTIGHTGELSPVGLLDPVDLDGSTVSRVSLYNKTKMESMGMFPGAVVTIKKSGDIIPQIIKINTPSPRTNEFVRDQNFYPTSCPSCNSKLEIQQDHDTAHIVCTSFSCPAQKSRKLASGIAALGIKGIGESLCLDLYKSGVEDIFDYLDPNKMSGANLVLGGIFKPGRQLDLLLKSVEQLKSVDLDKVILALQFDRLGNTGSKQVAKMFAGAKYSFDGLERAVVEPFMNPNSQQVLLVRKLMDTLQSMGVAIAMPKDITGAITFEMTGSPKDAGYAKKEDLIAYLATKGYAHTKLKDAKLLLTESYSSNSTKMKEAEKKGIQILTYEDLLEKLKN